MMIKTESIIKLLEIILNKKIDEINEEDLEKVTYLRIDKIDIDDILIVDSSDLQYFNNLTELSIENCIIDYKFIEDLKKLKNIKKISFINCEFINNFQDYFDQLVLLELVLNNVI